MTEQEFYDLRFPVGEFQRPETISVEQCKAWIDTLENFPESLELEISHLDDVSFNFKYRPSGWTIKQVIHHCADSHMNSIIRFKLALTENRPTIRPYYEDRFAKLTDYDDTTDTAIHILKGVHRKLGLLLRALNELELKREFVHPEHNKVYTIEEAIGLYAWHCNHHLAHIKQAINAKGKFN